MTRTVLITGASSGIGRAAAIAFGRRGDNVVLNGRDSARLLETARLIARAEATHLVPGDIGQRETCEQLVTEAVSVFGRVDVLVNNAGVFEAKPFLDYTERDLDGFLTTNLKGTYFASQAAVRQMRAQGDGGSIVNVTASLTLHAWRAVPASAAAAAKGGINTITTSLALELAQDNIRVNAVAPGLVRTPLHGRTEAQYAELNGLQPLGRVGHAEDIVEAILYLADADFTTGVVMPVDGGTTAGHW